MTPTFLRRLSRWILSALVLACSVTMAVAEEEEEEAAPSSVAIAISVMLLGSIGFIMVLFYLTNHPDEDIMRYSWRVISSTISIFCAVLLFQAFNGVVEEFVLEGVAERWELDEVGTEVGTAMVHMVIWLTILQLTLAIVSGAIGEEPEGGLEKVELNCRSWAVLIAHISGFATIHAFGTLQQTFLDETPLMALGAVPLAYFGQFALFGIFDYIRDKVALGDDGEVDEYEEHWFKETRESENDVAGLSLSFLTAQVIRFYVCGKLPNLEGLEPWAEETGHSTIEVVQLYVSGAMLGFGSIIIMQAQSAYGESWESRGYKRVARLADILNVYFVFGNAWCFFYASKWLVGSMQVLATLEEESLVMVVLAMFLSAVSFTVIYFLDKMNDVHLFGEGKQADDAIEQVIMALGILVGFSWEQSFDVAVSTVSRSGDEEASPAIIKLVLSFMLVAVVFPAWRWYILPTEQELNDRNETDPDDLHTEQYLKNINAQMLQMLLKKGTKEKDLDLAYLRMKESRWKAFHHEQHQKRSAFTHKNGEQPLTYLRITAARGIEDVAPTDPKPQLSRRDLLDLEEPLLPEHGSKSNHHGE